MEKETCPQCDGSGEMVHSVTYEGPWFVECPLCDGTGLIDKK